MALGLTDAWLLRWLSDDAFVSFTYARNFADGRGLVFNVAERVEGYTNFLWTCILAFCFHAKIDIFQAAIWLGISSMAATIIVLRAVARRRGLSEFAVMFACLYTVANYHFREFATSGLETMFFTFFATWAAFFLVRWDDQRKTKDLLALGGVLAVITLIRADGIVLYGLFLAGVFAGSAAEIGHALRLRTGRMDVNLAAAFGVRAVAIAAIPALAVLMPYLWWKWRFYGAILPNTFYLRSADKPYFSQGARYIFYYFAVYGQFIIFPLAALRRKYPPRASVPLWAIALGWLFYVAWVGGDFMFGRFLVPATPLFSLLVAEMIEARVWSRRAKVALMAALVIGATTAPWLSLRTVMPQKAGSWRDYYGDMLGFGWAGHVSDERATYQRRGIPTTVDARRLADEWRPFVEKWDGHVAFSMTQQRDFYFSGFRKGVDLCGLTNPVLGRAKIDARGRPGHEKRFGGTTQKELYRNYYPLVFFGCNRRNRITLGGRLVDGKCLGLMAWNDGTVADLVRRGFEVVERSDYLDKPFDFDDQTNVTFR